MVYPESAQSKDRRDPISLEQFLARLKDVRKSGKGWTARCPCRDHGKEGKGDRRPSLSIDAGDTRPIIVKCFTGCTTEAICAALGLTLADICGEDGPALPRASKNGREKKAVDWKARQAGLLRHRDRVAHVRRLAEQLGTAVSDAVLLDQGVGWRDGVPDKGWPAQWTWPEVDDKGNVVGILARLAEGGKKTDDGSTRGLIVYPGWAELSGPVLLPEGPTCTAALITAGLCAIGRPSCECTPRSLAWLAALLKDVPRERPIVVIAERDSGAGVKGGRKDRAALAAALGRPVGLMLPPGEAKDSRDWLNARLDDGADRAAPGAAYLSGIVDVPPEEGDDGHAEDGLEVAGLDDLERAGAEVSWLWKWWIPCGVLTGIGAEPEAGKTRFMADLVRRIRHGLPWPDEQAMTAPRDSLVLWVMADNQHDELVDLGRDFDIMSSVKVNAWTGDPYDGVSLETAEDLKALEARIRKIKPLLVIVDTVGNSCDKNLSRSEDARAFYAPLQVLARKYRCAIACLTHLNAGGKFLGRRVMEKVRVAIKMEQPDPADERRSLRVIRSHKKKPAPLGVTMGDKGNEYDSDPPKAPEGTEPGMPGGRAAPKLDACKRWLHECLSRGKRKVAEVRRGPEAAGLEFVSTTLYAAKASLGVIETGTKGNLCWELPPPPKDKDQNTPK